MAMSEDAMTSPERSLHRLVRPYDPDGPVWIICTECQANGSRRPWCKPCGSTGRLRAETVHSWRHRNPWPNEKMSHCEPEGARGLHEKGSNEEKV